MKMLKKILQTNFLKKAYFWSVKKWAIIAAASVIVQGVVAVAVSNVQVEPAFAAEALMKTITLALLLGVLSVAARSVAAKQFDVTAKRPKTLGYVILTGTSLFLAISYLAELLLPQLAEASKQGIVGLGIGTSWVTDMYVVTTIVILAPLLEEVLYRLILFRGRTHVIGKVRYLAKYAWLIAAVVSSFFFMSAHASEEQIAQQPLLFFMAFLLALAYRATGSLVAPIMIHSINNMIVVAVGIILLGISVSSPLIWLYLLLAPVALYMVLRAWEKATASAVEK